MKWALVLAAALLLAGCGHAKDPFIGSWGAVQHGPASMVISKQGSRYLAVEYLGHGPVQHLVYTRQGNHLVAVVNPWPFKCGADLDSTTGLLRLTPFAYVLKRTSTSTPGPIPTP
jgi:hypothetical protein